MFMSTSHVLAAGCVAVALAGCGSTGGPTSALTSTVTAAPSTITRTVAPPPPSLQQATTTWLRNTRDHLDIIVNAATAVQLAGEAEDISGMNIACKQYHDGVEGLQGHMPPPSDELKAKLQAALSDYDVAMHFCIEGTNDVSAIELQHTLEFMGSANRSMQEATVILERDTGSDVTLGS
ncbi:hypothetical protein [Mycobacterium antarcticum]|uniref:hypothetical protein n=1 Tax=Mycolicibacterium sp. TUM20984 TaxID=3023368 RepID=UPI00238A3FFC|nr:hypothetical protein [Mycolicibacterium sp. TUM20984]GLP83641.1 hypothetical protein TUM20984_50610 [Mycolicibacterium sp. TUM20984]